MSCEEQGEDAGGIIGYWCIFDITVFLFEENV
jgi:hypothetical protein